MTKTSGKHAQAGSRQARLESGLRRRTGTDGLQVAAASDMGRVRGNNEDTFRCDERAGFFVVCDGMGGMAAGEVASQVAADTAIREFTGRLPVDGVGSVQRRLEQAISAANREVLRAAQEPGRKGMGTTLVAAAVDGKDLLVANVGDSRAYLLQGRSCTQITRDHSYANEAERVTGLPAEEISPELLRRFGSLITRAMGAAETVEPEFFPVELRRGDVLLLASDGLTRYFPEPAGLLPLIDATNLKGSCQRLISAANAAGGVDNITVLLLARTAF